MKGDMMYISESANLAYKVVNDEVVIVGRGQCLDIHIVVPHYIDGMIVSGIGENAFLNDKNLESIYCSNVSSIGSCAFKNSNLKTFTCLRLEKVELNAFENCHIEASAVPVGYSVLFR